MIKMVFKGNIKANRKGGFTLIELLVVVLIIGILAAIASPQYQKAVWRSRNAELKALIKTIYQAQSLYYLEHGKYASNFSQLDIDLPLTPASADPCGGSVQGKDSVRKGPHFHVYFNSTDKTMKGVGIRAMWTDGKYRCNGFGWWPALAADTLWCTEIKTFKPSGAFCTQLEHFFYKSTSPYGTREYSEKENAPTMR